MKKSIVLIVAETRRTVGWLARGAAAQVRRVHLEDRHYHPPSSKSAALATAEATASCIAGPRNAPRRQRRSRLRSPVSNASRSAPEACLVGSGTSGTPTPNIGCRELDLRCPRAFGGTRDERKGSQRRADKWTV
jgi:hypothetical protein